jgi:pimeloyl-ACP methyl ester carboxylesterase
MNKLTCRFFAITIPFLLGVNLNGQDTVRFDKALLIQPGIDYNRTSIQYDPVAYAILNQTIETPTERIKLDVEGEDDPVWESIAVGENGYFNSRKLRGGYLYIQYDSPEEKVMILEATGHTMAFINGIPREGDHYNFGYSQIPVTIEKGLNHFYFTGGRFPMIRAMLTQPSSEAMFSDRDLTLPDLIIGEGDQKWAAVRIINSSREELKNLVIECKVAGGDASYTNVPTISPMNIRKVGFRIQDVDTLSGEKVTVQLALVNRMTRQRVDQLEFEIENKTADRMYARTFISKMDGSIQYFAVRPGNIPAGMKPALFFSVHGAGVEARNQARAYQPKDWGIVIAPTNRRPFGFAWEDWGRLDALEVLEIGKTMYATDPERTYLTGHSMGGHGTWYLGATYPDQFAAIAPCAGYADLLGYAVREAIAEEPSEMELVFIRAANPLRTRELAKNYLHHGIYILHGDADETVPVSQARAMRELLGTFHNDFTYYEYPGGSHWYGDISMDWPPIFDYFSLHTLKPVKDIRHIEFQTASPGVSSRSGWVTIHNQESPFEFSQVNMSWDPEKKEFHGTTENVSALGLDVSDQETESPVQVVLDNQSLNDLKPFEGVIWLREKDGKWTGAKSPDKKNKGPHRYGNFKDAYRNNMVFVYGTGGSPEENRWMYYKARFDAETFGYRGNGSIEIIPDSRFKPEYYADRNIVLFGNASTNNAWNILLSGCPVQVTNGRIRIGKKEWKGDDLGIYFIYPRFDSDSASVGIVAGTGFPGIKATYANQYFLAGPGFPDLALFRLSMLIDGYDAVECAGFFGNDWSVENGEFVWKK